MYYNKLICPYTKKKLVFVSKDLGSSIYKTYNEDIFFVTIPFCKNVIKQKNGKTFKYFIIDSFDLIPVLKLKYGWVKNPTIFKRIFYPLLEKCLSIRYSNVKILPSDIIENTNVQKKTEHLNDKFTYDHPDLYSIRRGDNLRLEKNSKFIIINVRNIFDSIITTDVGEIYDLYEWNYLRII